MEPVSVLAAGGDRASTVVFLDIPDELAPEDIPSSCLEELRHQYASLIIQLDRLRPALTRADASQRREDGEWSVREILGHMIGTDNEIWWPRIEFLLVNDDPIFTEMDPATLARKHNWRDLPLDDVLAQLMRIRWSHSMRLNGLPVEAFDRTGQHPTHGEITLLKIVQILVAHDAHSLSEIRERIELPVGN